MKLSIIIPIYNGSPFLERLIDSIVSFTFTDFECVFIDNNSTDDSFVKLKKLLQNTPIKYSILSEKKQGAGHARNTGIKMAKGEFLAFLDCDDIILPVKFEYDFNILEKHQVDFVFCRSKRFYEDGRILKHPIKGFKEGINTPPSLGLLWLQNFFLLQGTGSLVARKNVVEQLGSFHTSYTGEDAFLFIRMGLLFKGYFYDKTYFHYLRHKQSTISKSNREENGPLRRYFELRLNLFNDDIVKSNAIAMHIIKQQIQTDLLKMQQLGYDLKALLKDDKIKDLELSFLLFNPISLFINRKFPEIKYNPFYQIDIKIFKKRRDKAITNGGAKELKSLKIIIYDGSFNTTAFINRLASGLVAHHEIYILGFNEELTHKLDGVHYVPLGSNQNKFRFISTSVGYAIQYASIKLFFATLEKIFTGRRQALQEQNLRFALNKIKPDIIHLQWLSVIPLFEDVLTQQTIPVVLSQRGFHNNVRPFVDPENFAYLQRWYPKMAGFHSVSKAITGKGDIIWKTQDKLDEVVYTGLPLRELSLFKEYQSVQQLKLLSVGRTHWKKGYDYALRCCQVLKEKKVPFHYTIIGGAGDEELQFLLVDLGLQECVSLVDRLSQTEVFKKISEASLLLMSSVEEGLPNVAVEAMALGLPVLSTNCGGVLELVEDGVEGWVVPVRDFEAMAEGIVAFSQLPLEKIEEVRIAARKKVELQHSEEKMVRGMEELYYEVLKRQ